MDIPENVGLNYIQTSLFTLAYEIFPHLNIYQFHQKDRESEKKEKKKKPMEEKSHKLKNN